jgi:transcriptional regulator with XRE-family HTH domain
MEKQKITQIAKDLNVTHGAVSQWFNGLTLPKYKYMLILNRDYSIPFEAWTDIKSYRTETITDEPKAKEVQSA